MTNVNEDGIGATPTNNVGSVAGTGDSRLPADQREPGVNKKKKLRTILPLSPLTRKLP
jgi:hypothetical protein